MELISTRVCRASQIGVNENLFGGEMMSFMDESAAAYACQICDSPQMVTRKIEEVVFERPVKVGNLIKIYGGVVKIGRTSITVAIEARTHNVVDGTQMLVCTTRMVFVKIDNEGNPSPIDEVVKTRYEERIIKYGRGLLTPEEMEQIKKES